MASYADGVIVGSAFVRTLLDHADDPAAGLSRRCARSPRTSRTGCGVRRTARGSWRRPCSRRSCSPAAAAPRAADAEFAGTLLDPPFEVDGQPLDRHRRREPVQPRRRHRQPLTLVFFGYTHCPDVCGLVMSNLDRRAVNRSTTTDRTRSTSSSSPPTRSVDTAAGAARVPRPSSTSGFDRRGGRPARDHHRGRASRWASPSRRATSSPAAGYDVSHGTQVIGIDAADEAPVVLEPRDLRGPAVRSDIETLLSES